MLNPELVEISDLVKLPSGNTVEILSAVTRKRLVIVRYEGNKKRKEQFSLDLDWIAMYGTKTNLTANA